MEQEHHQWVMKEEEEQEVEDCSLETRKLLPRSKDEVNKGVVVFSSSSSSIGNGGGRTNGVDPDGSPAQKEEEIAEMGKICGEYGDHFGHDKVDDVAVGLGLVAEFVGEEATSGDTVNITFCAAESQNKNSVYFDKEQGTEISGLQNGEFDGVQNGSRSVLTTKHGEGESDMQVENSFIQNSPCHEINNHCVKTVDGNVPSCSELSPLDDSSDVQARTVTNSDNITSTKAGPDLLKEIDLQLKDLDVEAVLAKQETHDLFCPNCNSCITKRVILKKRKRNPHNLDITTKRDKLNKVVSSKLVDSSSNEANQGYHANETSDVGCLEPPADYHDPEREPEVFRCLSCFSFFIPTRKGFNLFRNFGGAREHETSQNPSSIPASNLQNSSNIPAINSQNPSIPPASIGNWLFSLFNSNKGEKSNEKGDTSIEHSRTGLAEQDHPSSITSDILTSPEIGHPEGPVADTAILENVKPVPVTKHGHGELNSLISSTMKLVKVEPQIENGIKFNISSTNEPLDNEKSLNSLSWDNLSSIQSSRESAVAVMDGQQTVGQDFKGSSANEQLLNVETNGGDKKNDSAGVLRKNMSLVSYSGNMVSKLESVPIATAATTKTITNAGEPVEDSILSPREGEPEFLVSSTGAQSPVQTFGEAVIANGVTSNKSSSGMDAAISLKQGFTSTKKVQEDIKEEIKNKGGDEIVSVEDEASKSTASLIADNVPVVGANVSETYTQVYIGEQPRAESGEPQQWEILRSIVYGGLVESITSLGIVSSAAGSGTAPLNIIALGLANLVGGLFILGHNLNELKNDHSGGNPQQMNMQGDRYQEVLGRRSNFLLHAVVAVLSFLIFGSVPLVIYGILIPKNYYVEIKLAAMVATSVVCIILLAIGKVYTRRPPKTYVKTLLYYVTLALAASGVSYVVGELIKDLLEKFNYSESGFAITMPFSDTRGMKPEWMSY